ncbi:hypothetical protein K488DRAFT_66444, partial [Vararia minispora EC-137]
MQASLSVPGPSSSPYYSPYQHGRSAPPSPRPRTTSSYNPDDAVIAFPSPTTFSSRPAHRTSKSDTGPQTSRPSLHSAFGSVTSFASQSEEVCPSRPASARPLPLPALTTPPVPRRRAARPLFSPVRVPPSRLPAPCSDATHSLDTQQGVLDALRLFHSGRVPAKDAEWYRFVPPEALSALDKHEVERQSVLFELIKSEKEYVEDLQLLAQVFVSGLRHSAPPVIPDPDRRRRFVAQVFATLDAILAHHERLLAALFDRQLEQHPLLQSLADLVLDNALLFLPAYEAYVKNSPIALELLRKERARNPLCAAFFDRCAEDPRVRRRDIKTLLSRPVTRLPRLRLLLDRLLHLAPPAHPDRDTLPLVLALLGDFIKSTEPGILVAESKVKFWDVCESLVYSKGEIIDLDLYDDERALVYAGPLARRAQSRTEGWGGWNDYVGVLLDNYFLLLKEEDRNGRTRRQVISRPIPLEYLRTVPTSFSSPPETRTSGSLLGVLAPSSSSNADLFPFTLFHAAHPSTRRYTLYTPTAPARAKWHAALVDALGVRAARQEANKLFALSTMNDGRFRVGSTTRARAADFDGRVSAAVSFCAFSTGRNFLAVGTASGIYVGLRADDTFRKVLPHTAPAALLALHSFARILVLSSGALRSYSADLLARTALGAAPPSALEGSCERIADDNVLFVRAGVLKDRTVVVYAVKSLIHVTLHALEAVRPDDASSQPPRAGAFSSYRDFGSTCYVPRDAYDVTFLRKGVAIATEKGVVIVDPTNLASSALLFVPDFTDAPRRPPLASLKSRSEATKTLGIARVDADELLVIYEEMGCYVDRHGKPARAAGYVRWETRAAAFAVRGAYLLLFSPAFIEIRLVARGRLVQV